MIPIGHCKTLDDAKTEALEYCWHARQPNNQGSRTALYGVANVSGAFFLVRVDKAGQPLPASWQPSEAEIQDFASRRPPLCVLPSSNAPEHAQSVPGAVPAPSP